MGLFIKGTIVLIMVLCSISASSNDEKPSQLEYQVKATLIYNFAKFINWPSESFLTETDPIVVGIVGKDPFGKILDETFVGQTVHGRTIKVNRVKDLKELRVSHILFISLSEAERFKEILDSIQGTSIVTISDIPDFERQGGMIGLFLRENRVRFSINIDAADFAHVKVNSQLLKISQVRKGS